MSLFGHFAINLGSDEQRVVVLSRQLLILARELLDFTLTSRSLSLNGYAV